MYVTRKVSLLRERSYDEGIWRNMKSRGPFQGGVAFIPYFDRTGSAKFHREFGPGSRVASGLADPTLTSKVIGNFPTAGETGSDSAEQATIQPSVQRATLGFLIPIITITTESRASSTRHD